MSAAHNDLMFNYSFEVKIEAMSFGFSRVNNISASAEIDTIVNGGHNDSPVIMVKPKKQPDMLVLERGLRTSLSDFALSFLKEGRKITNVMILVKRNGRTVRIFSFSNGIIVRREFAPLDALNGAVFVEAMQIAHTGLTEIALPF